MIIPNGYIEFITVKGVTLDETTGHPVTAKDVEYGELIPCQYQAASLNALALSNGESVTKASYNIYIESYYMESMWVEATERLRLSDRNGNAVNEFSIIRTEPLDAVCQYKIVV